MTISSDAQQELASILSGHPLEVRTRLKKFLDEATIADVENEKIKDDVWGTITPAQFKALHVYCRDRAKSLNDAGLTVQATLAKAMDLEWTPHRFKELMWKKSLKQLYGKKSTKRHEKQEEIDNVYNHIERFLGQEHHMETIPFPSNDARHLTELGGYKTQAGSDYDPALGLEDYKGPVTFD